MTKNKRSSSRIAAIQALFQIVSNTSDAQTVIREFIEFRFNKYIKGTQMRTHYDHIQSMFDGTMKGIPILSIVGLLNDN